MPTTVLHMGDIETTKKTLWTMMSGGLCSLEHLRVRSACDIVLSSLDDLHQLKDRSTASLTHAKAPILQNILSSGPRITILTKVHLKGFQGGLESMFQRSISIVLLCICVIASTMTNSALYPICMEVALKFWYECSPLCMK